MKIFIFIITFLGATILGFSFFNKKQSEGKKIRFGENTPSSIYEITVKNIKGEDVSLKQYKGKVLLIVNVASKCGYTPQYKGLQELYINYKDEDFVVLGFPCNDFGGQEPGTNEEIQEFCELNYGVTFPMFDKISLKGENISELYKWLLSQPAGKYEEVKWNFEKFLVSRDGKLIERYSSKVKPNDENLIDAIESEIE